MPLWKVPELPALHVAPMAGVSTPALVSAVARAGALGWLAAGYAPASALADAIRAVRDEAPGCPYGVNLFVPTRIRRPAVEPAIEDFLTRLAPELERAGLSRDDLPAPHWHDAHDWSAKLDVLEEFVPPVVSFTFGMPSAVTVQRIRSAGSLVVGTATTRAEAMECRAAGADAIVVQGIEAGGHRGTHSPWSSQDQHPVDELREDLRDLRMPLVVAGGIMTREHVDHHLDGGAAAVACGTAFLLSDEAATSAPWRDALQGRVEGIDETTLTRSFSGRIARGLRNRWVEEVGEVPVAGFPVFDQLTKPVRAGSTARGDAHGTSLWAGTGWREARTGPAAAIVEDLMGGIGPVHTR